ncbi:MAG TPA: NAD(+) diphosphatase [Solirubrobacteraceae bacterium]|nr:NAD(+) diphosphatase [Solirubrobacteraceae bacterium]
MLTFSGVTLDRAGTERLDPGWVAEHLGDPASRMLVGSADGVLVSTDPPVSLLRVPVPARPGRPAEEAWPVMLGLEDGVALFALDLDVQPPEERRRLTERGRIATLREAGRMLAPAEAGLAAYLVALLNWHRRHRFCSACGAASLVADGGFSRTCPGCGAQHFPRTDPAVIMLVEHDGHALLGRQAGWPKGQYSVLAGFVGPGESVEEAVIREVKEESGITIHEPRFVASQPWPFPMSVMLGFEAGSDGGEPSPGDGELEAVRWFSREEVGAALTGRSEHLVVPPGISISYFLIERWFARASPTAAD